jgi:hypothetical protein
MIRLTERGTDAEVYIQPHTIVRFTPKTAALGKKTYTYVGTIEADSSRYFEANESPADICRLIAAWERRYTASIIVDNGELPIFVFMDGNAIRFVCCQHTSELNKAADIQERDFAAAHE